MLTKKEKDELIILKLLEADKTRWLSMDALKRIAYLSKKMESSIVESNEPDAGAEDWTP